MRHLSCGPTLIAASLIGLLAMANGAKAQPKVAYVVNNVDAMEGTPTDTGDQYVYDLLVNDRGFDVTLVLQGASAAETLQAANDADLTIVSDSVSSGAVGTELKDATKPVLYNEPYLYDDLQWLSGTISNNFAPGDAGGNTPYDASIGTGQVFDSITIVDPNHPLAGGLTGDIPVYVDMDGQRSSGAISYGRVTSGPHIVATLPGNPDAATIFVHEPGDMALDNTEIPALRIGFFAAGLTFASIGQGESFAFSDGGYVLFNAALDYALNVEQPQPGDVDEDGDTDIDDYHIIRDHFQMNVADRGEGDLTRDGRVDFRDFRIWKSDPDRVAVAANVTIPEPASVCLALAAVFCLAALRRSAQA